MGTAKLNHQQAPANDRSSGVVYDFIARGQAAQAAVDRIALTEKGRAYLAELDRRQAAPRATRRPGQLRGRQ
jgi:hypothetical protein